MSVNQKVFEKLGWEWKKVKKPYDSLWPDVFSWHDINGKEIKKLIRLPQSLPVYDLLPDVGKWEEFAKHVIPYMLEKEWDYKIESRDYTQDYHYWVFVWKSGMCVAEEKVSNHNIAVAGVAAFMKAQRYI